MPQIVGVAEERAGSSPLSSAPAARLSPPHWLASHLCEGLFRGRCSLWGEGPASASGKNQRTQHHFLIGPPQPPISRAWQEKVPGCGQHGDPWKLPRRHLPAHPVLQAALPLSGHAQNQRWSSPGPREPLTHSAGGCFQTPTKTPSVAFPSSVSTRFKTHLPSPKLRSQKAFCSLSKVDPTAGQGPGRGLQSAMPSQAATCGHTVTRDVAEKQRRPGLFSGWWLLHADPRFVAHGSRFSIVTIVRSRIPSGTLLGDPPAPHGLAGLTGWSSASSQDGLESLGWFYSQVWPLGSMTRGWAQRGLSPTLPVRGLSGMLLLGHVA